MPPIIPIPRRTINAFSRGRGGGGEGEGETERRREGGREGGRDGEMERGREGERERRGRERGKVPMWKVPTTSLAAIGSRDQYTHSHHRNSSC
jgi:hypothetical protein